MQLPFELQERSATHKFPDKEYPEAHERQVFGLVALQVAQGD